ncbi:MAG: hypothetical protein OXT03_02985 [Alphaproteobacteria bacterium]|nr:hypothetical protein [Alphaproteobacteria bacterium]
MGKYDVFEEYLNRPISMSFREIERVLGFSLPPSAYTHREWWSNNPSNNTLTKAWLNAGYRTEQVDMKAQKLVFRRFQ